MRAPNEPTRKRAQVLISGGIDSTACLAFLLQNHFTVEATFVDFGQPACAREQRAARDITDFYRTPLSIFAANPNRPFEAGEIVGRNGFLLFACLMGCVVPPNAICIGVHAGTEYLDCSRHFVEQIDTAIAELTAGRTRVLAPFVDWDKSQIVAFAKAQALPLELTYSCESGNAPCGSCASCRDREALKC